MFGFTKKNLRIDVEFYEQGQLDPFARSTLPIDRLPDTFEIETTLNIQGEEWRVANARPATKVEFRKTGWLQIFLYKPEVTSVSVDKLLYTLPTISNDIAGLEKTSSLENVFVVHEDDWRQQELVSRSLSENVLKEFLSIRRIYDKERVEFGFRSLHVRSLIPLPLKGVHLTLDELKSRLGAAHLYRGIAFNNVAAVIQNGFAFQSHAGSIVWGQCRDDEVAIVCIRILDELTSTSNTALMDSLLADFSLLFVDWVNLLVFPQIDEELQ